MATQFPLREKRKAQTRANLIRAAVELFAENGYDNTTLEQVAEKAGLHVQTLYRHFRSKQELATAGDQDLLDQFSEAITDPARQGSTFRFWRGWVERMNTMATQDGGKMYRSLLRQRYGTATMSTRVIAIGHNYEDLLAKSLAQDLKLPSTDGLNHARLAAITLFGSNNHVIRRYATDESVDLVAESVRAANAVEALFQHLFKA